jgi:hypothetical protein
LRRYDAVVHTDVDELLVADPSYYSGLQEFAEVATEPVMTASGSTCTTYRIGKRHWTSRSHQYATQMGSIFGSTVQAGAGAPCSRVGARFHCCDAPIVLDRLYLLHMRYADLGAGLRRLARTRVQAVLDPAGSEHQRVSDVDFEQMMRAIAGLPGRTGA